MKLNRVDCFALLAGIILPLAFSPFFISPLAFLSPALLMYTWFSATPSQAFRRGFFFGIGFFSVGISWVYVSIHVFGDAPIPLAILITAFFISYLSLFPALQGYCLNKLLPSNTLFKLLLAFPVTWVISEILRGWLFTGFPWLFVGYSQSNTWLKGFAPLFGVYGLSFITVFLSALLFTLFIFKALRYRIASTACVLLTFLSGFYLSKISWTQPIGLPIRTTLIQGNIEQETKWQPEQIIKTLDIYTRYTQENWSSDLIVWPEAALTIPLEQASNLLNDLGNLAAKNNATIITGIPIITKEAAYNGMVAIGNGKGTYHKRHLVPFGEYIPLKVLWGFVMKAFSIPMSNCQPGAKSQEPLMAKDISIAPYICYEVAYPLEFLAFLPQAKLLLTITDDSWFGHSIAAEQHLQMAQLRAMETRRYLLFSSNTGITAVINPQGQIVKTIPAFQEAELSTLVQPRGGSTPWIIWKMYPFSGLMLLTVMIGWRKRAKANSLSLPLAKKQPWVEESKTI